MKTNYTPNTSNLLKSSTALTEGSEDHSAQNRYSASVMCNEAVALPPLPKKKMKQKGHELDTPKSRQSSVISKTMLTKTKSDELVAQVQTYN